MALELQTAAGRFTAAAVAVVAVVLMGLPQQVAAKAALHPPRMVAIPPEARKRAKAALAGMASTPVPLLLALPEAFLRAVVEGAGHRFLVLALVVPGLTVEAARFGLEVSHDTSKFSDQSRR
jgi:hypothetical protein